MVYDVYVFEIVSRIGIYLGLRGQNLIKLNLMERRDFSVQRKILPRNEKTFPARSQLKLLARLQGSRKSDPEWPFPLIGRFGFGRAISAFPQHTGPTRYEQATIQCRNPMPIPFHVARMAFSSPV